MLIGSSKDNHDHAWALARHFSNRGGTRKDSPKFPARGDCRTGSVTVARVRGSGGVSKLTFVFVLF